MSMRESTRWAKYEELIERIPFSGCWIWTGNITPDGYGRVTFQKKTMALHRVFYEKYKGIIPKGLQIDHLCRVRCCVNPNHMEAVTGKINCGRGKYAMQTHCKRGHPFDIKNTRRYMGRRICRRCVADRNLKRYHLRRQDEIIAIPSN